MRKNKLLLLVLALAFFAPTIAQNKGKIGFSFSAFNYNEMLRTTETGFDNTTKGRGFMSFAANYWHPINSWLEVETGVTYNLRNFETSSLDVASEVSPENKTLHMVNIPIGVRATFLKYGFVNSGILIDLLEEPGIGSYVGAGLKVDSPVGVGMFINPYIKMHSVLPIDFNLKANRIIDAGIQIGISYSFDNMFTKQK